MYKRVLCLGMIAVALFYGATAAQQAEISGLYVGERDRWQTDLISLLGDNWYLRVTVGALANIHPRPFQPTGFARLHLGLRWSPNWLLTSQVQVARATHEIGLGLENIGSEPRWVLEITPLIVDFNINPRVSTKEPREQPVAQDQQAAIDFKALVLSRWDDLLKASEQMAKEKSIDAATLTDTLKEFKKLFEANKLVDAALQLSGYSALLRILRKMGALSEYDETHLRAGLHRLMAAAALFGERVPPPPPAPLKICTGLYLSEDKKTEEVLSPFLIAALKTLTFTNKTTGAKEAFTLKESKCF